VNCEEHVRLAAELAAKLHDEKLFKQPPPKKDCPICFIRLPSLPSGSTYQSCCGKSICSGCFYAPLYDNQGNKVDNKKCPFCRIPYPTSLEEEVQRIKKRGEAGDAEAFFNMGCYYRDGSYGYPQDYTKALEFYHRAAKLGLAKAYCSIGYCYHYGRGVRQDMKKANNYYELGAIGGEEVARYNVAMHEERASNIDRALEHHMIAVRSGDAGSLGRIKALYRRGFLTKDDYTQALRSYQEYLSEIKSKQRDEAAAAYEKYRYY